MAAIQDLQKKKVILEEEEDEAIDGKIRIPCDRKPNTTLLEKRDKDLKEDLKVRDSGTSQQSVSSSVLIGETTCGIQGKESITIIKSSEKWNDKSGDSESWSDGGQRVKSVLEDPGKRFMPIAKIEEKFRGRCHIILTAYQYLLIF